MRAFKIFAVAVGLCVLLWASGIAPQAYNLIQNNGSSLTARTKLNFINSGCVDDPGNGSTDCSIGGGGLPVYSNGSVTFTGTQFLPIGGGMAIQTTEANAEIKAPVAATLSNLSVQISAALGGGNSAVFTWRDGGASQSLTCTISGAAATNCQDNTHTFTVNQGDEIDIQVATTGTPSAVTVTIATQFGAVSTLNPTIQITNASSTGTTLNTLTKLTGAPSTAVIAATTDTGGIVGITTSGAGTSGTATITTAGKIPCAFDGATTANDYVQNSTMTGGDCTDAGATYPTSGQVLGRVLSTNGSAGSYQMDLFPSEIKGASGGGGGFIQTLTAPVAANFSQINFNTGSGVTTTQTNNSTPVTSISLIQSDPSTTTEIAGITKAKIAATFTVTIAWTMAPGTGGQGLAGLWLTDGSANNLFICYQAQSNGILRAPVFSSFAGAFVGDVVNAATNLVGPLAWARIQETASNRLYFISSDGNTWTQIASESNTAHFTTTQYGFAVENRGGGGSVAGTLYSFTESTP